MEDKEKIEMILEWAAEHPNFDTQFVEELEAKFWQYGKLTTGQSLALVNIIESFRIDE